MPIDRLLVQNREVRQEQRLNMKKGNSIMRNIVIGLAMASTALTTPAMAREGQWYIQGDAGAMIVEDITFDINGVSNGATASHDSGWDAGVAVGHDFGGFRVEAETSYRRAGLEDAATGTEGLALNSGSLAPGGINLFRNEVRPAAGITDTLSFMLNGLVDFGDDDGLQGFVGGGVGVARVDMEGRVNVNGPGLWDDSDTGLAWQVLAGVRAPVSDRWDVGLKYRFFRAESVDLIDPLGRDFSGSMTTHSLLGSLIYNFGGEAPPPPPSIKLGDPRASPPPFQPPPLVGAPGIFMVNLTL